MVFVRLLKLVFIVLPFKIIVRQSEMCALFFASHAQTPNHMLRFFFRFALTFTINLAIYPRESNRKIDQQLQQIYCIYWTGLLLEAIGMRVAVYRKPMCVCFFFLLLQNMYFVYLKQKARDEKKRKNKSQYSINK